LARYSSWTCSRVCKVGQLMYLSYHHQPVGYCCWLRYDALAVQVHAPDYAAYHQ
jgi:hypothetical protein